MNTLHSIGRFLLSGGIIWNLTTLAALARDDDGRDTAPSRALVRDAAPRDFTPSYLSERLGIAQRASILSGVPVEDRNGHKLGKLDDVVVDLSSGSVYCALVSTPDSTGVIAIPGRDFYSADEKEALLEDNDVNISKAPRVAGTEGSALVNSLPAAYGFFNQKTFWDANAAAGHARKCRELIGTPVRNAGNELLGHVVNVVVDLPTARVLFVVVSFAGRGSDLYAVPPKAFQSTTDRGNLVLNVDREKIASIAHSDGFFWSNMASPAWSIAAYQNFGVAPDFVESKTNITDREQVRAKVETPTPTRSDRDIQHDILTAMMRDNVENAVTYNKVLILASNGEVTLRGRVKNDKQRAKLVEIASGVVGAGNVHDELQLK